MDIEKIEELIKVLEGSHARELSVRKGETSVHVRKGISPKPAPARPAKAAPAAKSAPEPQPAAPDETFIISPMVGLFHTVDGISEVGSQINAGQVVGHIESMKLLNDVVADVSGIVVEALVEDGMPVEYGQPLCKLQPFTAEVAA